MTIIIHEFAAAELAQRSAFGSRVKQSLVSSPDMALTALVWSLGFLSVAGQYDDNVGSVLPTPTVESNCFQNQLNSNQVYYQKKEDMFDGSNDELCAPGVLVLFVNKPCTWAAGKATMTVAPVINQCHWDAIGPFETSTGTTARTNGAT